MSFRLPKNFGTSQRFFFVQQAILVGGNQDANRAGNTQFHCRGNMPCTNFINYQKVTLVFVRINDGFTFAKVQAGHTHQQANSIAVANGNLFEKLAGFHLFGFFQKILVRSQFFINCFRKQDFAKKFSKDVKPINFKERNYRSCIRYNNHPYLLERSSMTLAASCSASSQLWSI